jgi:hypothetical protein
MEQETNSKINWKRLLITTAIVVATAGIIGGTVWYFMDREQKNKQQEIDNLSKQIEAQKSKDTKSQSETPKSTTISNEQTSKEVIPSYASNWYKFTSPNYGFSFRYPKVGIDVKKPSQPAEACSYPLKVTDGTNNSPYFKENGFSAFWIYGEFFGISVRPSQSIASYIKSVDPDGYRSYQSISVSGAKEAVKINTELAKPYNGYPPLSYVHYILNDGKNLYLLQGFQDAGFADDCTPTNFLEVMQQIVGTFNFYN